MKAYYSHPKSYRRSPEASEDIDLLKSLGYEVENPYDPKFSDIWQSEGITFGRTLVEMCDVVAFRPLSNGKIGAGVGKEVGWALELGKEVIEMPSAVPFDVGSLEERVLSIEDTLAFFEKVGK